MFPIDPSVDLPSFIGAGLVEIFVWEYQIGFLFDNGNKIIVHDGPVLLLQDSRLIEMPANPPSPEVFSLIGRDVESVSLAENRQDLTISFQGNASLKILGNPYYESYELIVDEKTHIV